MKVAIYAGTPVFFAILLWLAGSFVNWEVNPGNWSEVGRGLVVTMWAALTLAFAGIAVSVEAA